MILQVYPPPYHKPITVTATPDADIVEKTVREQPWKSITFVALRQDDNNWIEVSGSLDPSDGLSARVSEDGVESISSEAPETLDLCISLMLSYLRGDNGWRTAITWE